MHTINLKVSVNINESQRWTIKTIEETGNPNVTRRPNWNTSHVIYILEYVKQFTEVYYDLKKTCNDSIKSM